MQPGQGMIRPLPAPVVNSLRASCTVHRLDIAVEECINNSIDAKASSIAVCITEDSAQIVDDGEGIAKADFQLLGHWHCTSKELTNERAATLGFRGDTLAAIATVAVLEITSKHARAFETVSKVLEGGKTVQCGLASLQQRRQGTTVWIREFRARSHHSEPGEVQERTRHRVFIVACVHPHVRFQVIDGDSRHLLLNLPKGRSDASMLSAVFGDQPYCCACHTPSKQLCLRLLISEPGTVHFSRHNQLIYVNHRAVACPQLTTLINSLHQAAHHAKGNQTRTGSPAFIVMIECHACLYSLSHDGENAAVEFADWSFLLSTVRTAMVQSLGSTNLSDAVGAKTAAKPQQSDFIDRHCSGVGARPAGERQAASGLPHHQQAPPKMQAKRSLGVHKAASCKTLRSHSAPAAPGATSKSGNTHLSISQSRELIPGRFFDQPSAPSLGSRMPGRTRFDGCGSSQEQADVDRLNRLSGLRSRQPGDQQVPGAMERFSTPHVLLTNSSDTLYELWANPCTYIPDILVVGHLAKGFSAEVVPETLTKQQLNGARVVKQVDSKFVILICKDIIAVMDQHAADERVLLEHMLAQVEQPAGSPLISSQPLDRPALWVCSSSERGILLRHQRGIESWGWRYSLEADSCKALMTHVPCVLGRALTSITDLKAFAAVLEDVHGAAKVPQAVMRVLASKACRTAIMFGDRLSVKEAQELVACLQRTILWSSCAHGRPTIAPLGHLPTVHRLVQMRGTESTDTPCKMPLRALREKLRACTGKK